LDEMKTAQDVDIDVVDITATEVLCDSPLPQEVSNPEALLSQPHSPSSLLLPGTAAEVSTPNSDDASPGTDSKSPSNVASKVRAVTIFSAGLHDLVDGEIVKRDKSSLTALGPNTDPCQHPDVTFQHPDVTLCFEPEAEQQENQNAVVWTKWNITKTVLVVLVVLVCTVSFGVIPNKHGHSPRPHDAQTYAVMVANPVVIPVKVERYSFVQVDIFVERPPTRTYVHVSLQQRKSEGSAWTNVGDSWNVTLSRSLVGDYAKRGYRLVGPSEQPHEMRLFCSSNAPKPLAFSIKALPMPAAAEYEVVIAGLILILVYGLIIFELIPRVLVAMVGALVCLVSYSVLHERPSIEYIVTWIDYETVILLFGMMVMVQILSNTGAFEKVTLYGLVYSRGDPWRLICILSVGVAVTSAFLDNVTCMLLLVPVCIRLCQVMNLPPQPTLIAAAVLSNIGGAATGVGDPPNIIIINYKGITASGIGFAEFSLHCTLAAIVCGVVAIFQLRFMYRHKLKEWRDGTGSRRGSRRRSSFGLTAPLDKGQHRLIKARSTGRSIVYRTQNAQLELYNVGRSRVKDTFRNALLVSLAHFEDRLDQALDEAAAGAPPDVGIDIDALRAQYKIRNKVLLYQSVAVLTFVVLLFFFGSVLHMHLNLPWVALLGFMALVLLSGESEVEHLLEHIEWGTLLFFAALFILMHGLEKMGLIEWIGDRVVELIAGVDPENRMTVAIILLLWVSGLASAFIDNIPYTAAMCPVIVKMSSDLDIPLRPLVWTLALGACLGGNGTIIGASANVVTAGLSQQYGYPISFMDFFRVGFPIMLVSMCVLTVWLLLLHPGFGWDMP